MTRLDRQLVLTFIVIAAMLAGAMAPALAEEDWSSLDINEHLMGATNVHAIAGNGGLSVGLSDQGDLSILSWPSPSYTDQLAYITSNHPDARKQPHFGAKESMGSFFGLRYRKEGEERFTWLRGEGWTASITYASDVAPIPVTTLKNSGLGLTVVITDVVYIDRDVLIRHVEVRADTSKLPGFEPTALVFYANLSPTLSRIPKLPLADWALDTRNDFVAVYDRHRDILFHFRPGDKGTIDTLADMIIPPAIDYGRAGELLKQTNPFKPQVQDLAEDLDGQYGPGVYIAMSGEGENKALGVQVGFDTTDLCGSIDDLGDNILLLPERFPDADPMDLSALDMLRCAEPVLPSILEDQGWAADARDAYLAAPEGLNDSYLAAGQVNTALDLKLNPAGNGYETSVYIAFGSTAEIAAGYLTYARDKDFDEVLDWQISRWENRFETLRLPESDDADILAFCKRTLVNLFVGTDKNTGATVASLSRQPAYAEDWPRDGAYFNAVMDAAGLTDLVTERLYTYMTWQRSEDEAAEPLIDPDPPPDPADPDKRVFPAGAWEMNYYADGMNGGFIRYEIDNTAFIVWSYAYHAGFIKSDDERMTYLYRIWPSLKAATDLLVRWRDPETGLPAPANENDNPAYTSTLFGAGPVYAAILNAARVAKALDYDELSASWEARAVELRAAILKHLVDKDTGLLLERRNISGHPGSNLHAASSTAIWPGRLLAFDDERTQKQMTANLDDVLTILKGQADGGSYLNKVTLTAALTLTSDAGRDKVREALDYLARKLPTKGTRHVGEVFLMRNGGYDQRVATPHLWAASLTFLTAMAVYQPDLFDRHLCRLPRLDSDTADVDCSWIDRENIYSEDSDYVDPNHPNDGDDDSLVGQDGVGKRSDGKCASISSHAVWLWLAVVLGLMVRRRVTFTGF